MLIYYSIMGPLMENRTCILVTHNTALCVPRASFVVVLDNGKVVAQGNPVSVLNTGFLGDSEQLKNAISAPASQTASGIPSRVASFNGSILPKNGDDDPATAEAIALKLAAKAKAAEETKTEGSVDWRVYQLYLKSMGPWWFWVLAIATFVIQQIGSVASSIWIREW